MKLHYVDDGVPEISTQIIAEACEAREVELIVHEANTFVFAPEQKASAGDLLFRPAISAASMRVEQFLYQPGVATFYRSAAGVFWNCNDAVHLFQSEGIPIPRTFYVNNADRGTLDYYVEQLGGFPVILKVLGHSRGVGVMRLDGVESLYSVVDYVAASGQTPILCTYIDNAVHWRCMVVGDRVVAAYINPQDANDFRTYGTTDPDEVYTEVGRDLSEVSIAATRILDISLGGVDVLRHESGRCYVLECNFPCYYAHAQEVGGVDVAGAMLEFLIDKAERLAADQSSLS